MALAYTVRNQLLERWLHTVQNYNKPGVRIVSYLSAEFLLGPHLENNLINLGIYDEARDALKDLGLDLRKMIDQRKSRGWETEAWQTGGLLLDSLATLEIPAVGYGIRYEFGIFDQEIRNVGRWK